MSLVSLLLWYKIVAVCCFVWPPAVQLWSGIDNMPPWTCEHMFLWRAASFTPGKESSFYLLLCQVQTIYILFVIVVRRNILLRRQADFYAYFLLVIFLYAFSDKCMMFECYHQFSSPLIIHSNMLYHQMNGFTAHHNE